MNRLEIFLGALLWLYGATVGHSKDPNQLPRDCVVRVGTFAFDRHGSWAGAWRGAESVKYLASPLLLMLSSATIVLSTLFLSTAMTSAEVAKKPQTRN